MPNPKRADYWFDGLPGFGLRVTPKGSKSFVYLYSFGNRKFRLTLGRYPATSLRKARRLYADAAEQIEHGINPVAEKNRAQSKDLTVNHLVDKYEAHNYAQRKVSGREEIRALRKDLASMFGDMKVQEIQTDHIRQVLMALMARKRAEGKKQGAPQMANHLYAFMHRMFALAVQWGHIPYNPVSPLDRPAKPTKGSRVLNFVEIHALWKSLSHTSMDKTVQAALKFMLVTGQRGKDVREMRWRDFNRHDGVWTIPTPKNSRSWRVPLNRYAVEILTEMKGRNAGAAHPFVLANGNTIDKYLLNHNVLREKDKLLIEPFRPHDLRRTNATLVTSLGCPRFWASLILNHTDGSVTSIYDQYSYDYEKRKAVQVVEFALDHILSANQVQGIPSLDEMRSMVRESGILNSA